MENKINRFVYWAPRVLSILFVLFLAMFSLDVFEPGSSAQEIAIGLLAHNVPVLLLAAVVAVSWKREIVGGITFILAGIFYIVMLVAGAMKNGFEWHMISWFLTISGPAFLVGALFLLGWCREKAEKTNLPDKK